MHIEVVNASTPIKTEKFREKFIFDTSNLEDENQIKMAEELNTLITNSLGTNEETLLNKRFIVLSLKAKNFLEANALFLNMYLKTEQKFKELKSKVRLVPVKERLKFIHDFLNNKTLEDKKIDNICSYAKENNISIFDIISPKSFDMRESDFIEVDGKFLRVLYVSKLPKSITPRFYNRITTLDNINLITTLNITPTNPAKMMKQVDKSLSAMETERLEKIKKAGKNNLDYEYVKDKKLETRISNAQQLQYDLQKNNQKIFQNNILVCISASSFEELEDQTVRVHEVASEMLIEMKSLLWQQLEGLQNLLPLGHNNLQFQRTLTSEATAANVPFNSKDFLHEKSLFYGINLVSKNALCCDRKKLINGNGCVLATSGAGKSFSVKTIIEQILLRYPEDNVVILDPMQEYNGLLETFHGQKITISTTSDTHVNPFDLDLNYGVSDSGKNNPLKAKTEYIIAFFESIVSAGGLSELKKPLLIDVLN